MVNCCVAGCKTWSNSVNHGSKRQSLFRLPKDPTLFEYWRSIIPKRYTYRELRKNDVVCGLHFTKDMIIDYEDFLVDEKKHEVRTRPKLVAGAYPTIFPFAPNNVIEDYAAVEFLGLKEEVVDEEKEEEEDDDDEQEFNIKIHDVRTILPSSSPTEELLHTYNIKIEPGVCNEETLEEEKEFDIKLNNSAPLSLSVKMEPSCETDAADADNELDVEVHNSSSLSPEKVSDTYNDEKESGIERRRSSRRAVPLTREKVLPTYSRKKVLDVCSSSSRFVEENKRSLKKRRRSSPLPLPLTREKVLHTYSRKKVQEVKEEKDTDLHNILLPSPPPLEEPQYTFGVKRVQYLCSKCGSITHAEEEEKFDIASSFDAGTDSLMKERHTSLVQEETKLVPDKITLNYLPLPPRPQLSEESRFVLNAKKVLYVCEECSFETFEDKNVQVGDESLSKEKELDVETQNASLSSPPPKKSRDMYGVYKVRDIANDSPSKEESYNETPNSVLPSPPPSTDDNIGRTSLSREGRKFFFKKILLRLPPPPTQQQQQTPDEAQRDAQNVQFVHNKKDIKVENEEGVQCEQLYTKTGYLLIKEIQTSLSYEEIKILSKEITLPSPLWARQTNATESFFLFSHMSENCDNGDALMDKCVLYSTENTIPSKPTISIRGVNLLVYKQNVCLQYVRSRDDIEELLRSVDLIKVCPGAMDDFGKSYYSPFCKGYKNSSAKFTRCIECTKFKKKKYQQERNKKKLKQRRQLRRQQNVSKMTMDMIHACGINDRATANKIEELIRNFHREYAKLE